MFVLGIPSGVDLHEYLRNELSRRGVKSAFFIGIGAFRRATIAWYDQTRREYKELEINEPVEVASLMGSLTIKEGEPFLHIHVVLGDSNGRAYAGHLISAQVFTAELVVNELPPIERSYDSGLGLWTLKTY